MRETLFFIPHFLFEGPLFYGWLVVGAIILVVLWMKEQRRGIEFIPFYLVVGGLIHFVLPGLEVQGVDTSNPNGPLVPVGIAVRGYGLFLLLGMASGFTVVYLRAAAFGIKFDHVLSLTFTMVVSGILGARLFYVIQKFEQFPTDSILEFLKQAVDMTEGGLVVYGSLIGGLVGASVYLAIYRLPIRLVADLLAPGMVLGLALGRVGCLMNGCCYGGICEVDQLPTISFPPSSPPYMNQLAEGELLGMELKPIEHPMFRFEVVAVEPGSIAAEAGIKDRDLLNLQLPDPIRLRSAKRDNVAVEASMTLQFQSAEVEETALAEPTFLTLPAQKLPVRSRPVHPTQIYSSINAFLMTIFLWFYFPFRKSDGEVFALMLLIYSVARYLLETIRTDEAGQFGTAFTISQWISFIVFLAALGAIVFLRIYRPLKSLPEPIST